MRIQKLQISALAIWSSLWITTVSFGQQKVQFTQYMFDASVINPAYVGADEALSLTFIHRNQWSGVEGSPKTETLSAHTLFKEKQVGVGLIVNYDQIGIHKNFNIATNYAYHLQVGKDQYLSLGLQAGVHNSKADYASLYNRSGNDPVVGGAYVSETFFDIGFGLFFRSPRLQMGLSVPEIIPNEFMLNDSSVLNINERNQFLFMKYKLPLNENFEVAPSVLLKYLKGVPFSFDVNMNFTYKKVITAGVSYRKDESCDFLLKLFATPQLQVGYSYDYPIGNSAYLSNASHEIMARYLFKFKASNVASPR